MAEPSAQQSVELALHQHLAGRHREAETLCRLVLEREPDHPDALHLLGMLAHKAGRPLNAISLLSKAIALNPADATYPNNLGMILRSLGRLDEAISAYARSIALAPGIAQTHYNVANALKDLGKLDDAIASYGAAIKLRPNFPDAYNNLAAALKTGGQIEAAIDAYRKSLEIHPSPEVEGNLLYALHFHPAYGPADILREHVRWNDRYARPFAATIQPHANERSAHRRLRLGYVSADFRYHPVGRFLGPLFAEHDHGEFEVFCYSDVTIPDAVTQDLRQHADCWRDVAGLSHERLAELIRSDRIDILIDLSMHLEGTRLMTFARKPAPVQATYLAYCSTTGLQTMDYRLTDPYLDPPQEDGQWYTERTMWLPQTYWCYAAPAEAPEPAPLPALQSGSITFGCLNNFAKVSLAALNLWREALAAIPQSQLVLHALEGSHRDRVRDMLLQRSIDPRRVRFIGHLSPADYFAAYRQIDIGLDPYPYGGGTTTLDALWMGVPVVSLRGNTAVSRAGLSILSNAGLPALAARTPEEFIATAVGLSREINRLSNLREVLRLQMRRSPLMDAARFARDIETAFRAMWREWVTRV